LKLWALERPKFDGRKHAIVINTTIITYRVKTVAMPNPSAIQRRDERAGSFLLTGE